MAPRCTFSIVTVCRNAERSIARTVDSVLGQADFGGTVEHLIIDGASTDGTLQRLAAYPHLCVLSEPDAGVYHAMNKGVRLASGTYIALLNADDWYEPDTLAAVAEAFRVSPEVSIVHGDIRRWNQGEPIGVVKPSSLQPHRAQLAMPFHHPASFVRRELFDRFGAFDTTYRIFADFEWMSRVVKGGALLHYCPQVFTNFQIGGLSTMRCAARERFRVFRSVGAGSLRAAAAAGYGCAAVLRNRLLPPRGR